jgi:hypothetical protein
MNIETKTYVSLKEIMKIKVFPNALYKKMYLHLILKQFAIHLKHVKIQYFTNMYLHIINNVNFAIKPFLMSN